MKFYLVFVALFALLAAVSALETSHKMVPMKAGNNCFKCLKSYIDCFNRFGVKGCTDENAEHHTYCRECTGVDPKW